jgi:hypothetical protein
MRSLPSPSPDPQLLALASRPSVTLPTGAQGPDQRGAVIPPICACIRSRVSRWGRQVFRTTNRTVPEWRDLSMAKCARMSVGTAGAGTPAIAVCEAMVCAGRATGLSSTSRDAGGPRVWRLIAPRSRAIRPVRVDPVLLRYVASSLQCGRFHGKASACLREAGESARPLAEEAARSGDSPGVRTRAASLLATWGRR